MTAQGSLKGRQPISISYKALNVKNEWLATQLSFFLFQLFYLLEQRLFVIPDTETVNVKQARALLYIASLDILGVISLKSKSEVL